MSTGKLAKDRDLIYGVHPILELLRAKKRKLYILYVSKPIPKVWHRIEKNLSSYTQVKYVPKETLAKLAGTTDHQGFVGLAGMQVTRKKFFDTEKAPFLVILAEIQDTRNVGAIVRSAYCTNASGIIITTKNSAPLNTVAIKSSAGLSEHLEIYQSATPMTAVQEAKKAGYHIYFAALGGENATTVTYQQPLCIVIGNEAAGIPKNILSQGTIVTLPQKEADISYNASVAAGILCFTVAHKIGSLS